MSSAGSTAVRANLNRERATTLVEKKSSIMHKNLIAEEDDELVSESNLGASNKKKAVLEIEEEDYSDDFD